VSGYWLGVSHHGGFDLDVQIDRRSFDRIRNSCRVIADAFEPGIIDVLRANAGTVLELLATLDAHIAQHGVSAGLPFPNFMFFLRTPITNWLMSWGAYGDHCAARHPKESPARAKVIAAQNGEFDASSAYRLAEGLRNYVTHVRLPPIRLSVSEHDDPAAGESTPQRHCRFEPDELLTSWNNWSRLARLDLEGSSTPILLDAFVVDSLACAERIEVLMQGLERPARRRAARVVQRARERIAGEGAPCMYEREATTRLPGESRLTQYPLPIQAAEQLLS
jgi:hypothetical protein